MSRRLVAIGFALVAAGGLGGRWFALRAAAVPAVERMTPERLDQAIAYIDRALAGDPRNPMLKGQLIGRLILRFGQQADLGDLVRAEDLAASAVALASDKGSALARLSGVMLMQHKFGLALATAETALAADSSSADAHGARLEAAIAAGQYRVADAEAARLDQTTLAGLVRRAMWLDASGNTPTARQLMTQACRQIEHSGGEPQVTAWCLTQLAGLVHTTAGPDQARRLLERVLELAPGYRGAVEGLANLALAQGDIPAAIQDYRTIRSDAHPDLYLRLADAYRQAGQVDSAAAAERRFLAIAGVPANEALFGNVLALYYAERGDRPALDSALAITAREIVRRPTNESFDLLAWVHFRRGEFVAALSAANRTSLWGSAGPTMQYHRARILASLGRKAEARRVLAAATAAPTLLAPHAHRDWRLSEALEPSQPALFHGQ